MQELCRRVIIEFLKRAQAKYNYAKTGWLGAHAESLLTSLDLRTILLLMRDVKKEDFDFIVEAGGRAMTPHHEVFTQAIKEHENTRVKLVVYSILTQALRDVYAWVAPP